MFGRSFIAAAVTLFLVAGATQALAAGKEKGAAAPAGSNEIQAKLGADYIAVAPLRMAVQVDANRAYRSLELEVWLFQADPEKRQVLNSKKKQIAEQMKEDFAAYNWEAFEDASGGPLVAKRVVAASVEKACGIKVEDVMIKTLVLK
ncbi:MAG TPA: hypothetical protein VN809_09850 [Telmatospirillum sp.]|nr:hypothetical protein [Telmatospirillum sp.]